MEKDIIKLLEKIITNSVYNPQTKTYQISKEFYNTLNLSTSQRNQLKKLCEINEIILEHPNKNLPKIKCEHLFKEYNDIMKQLEKNITPSEKEKLEKRRIYLRNIIAESNLELIRTIINRRINGKNKMNVQDYLRVDLEDLYQYGYEFLLEYIDKHYLNEETFKNNMITLLMFSIKNIHFNQLEISQGTIEQLIKLKKIITNENISLKEIQELTNLTEEKIKRLLILDKILNPSNLENITLQIDSPLEEIIELKIKEEQTAKLIQTLSSKNQQRVINLTFGLNGEKQHTREEIAKILKTNQRNIQEIKTNAIKNLMHPIYLKYLSQIFNLDKSDYLLYSPIEDLNNPQNKKLKKLEKFLLHQLKQEDLYTLLESIPPKFRTVLLKYLNYTDGLDNVYPETNTVNRETGLNLLRQKITEKYVNNNQNEDIKDYFDYLMQNYLTRKKIKK